MRKSSDNYQPDLSERGEAAMWLMAQMMGEAPVGQLAAQLQAQFPAIFGSDAEALKFVKDLAKRYS
jgi:hypothetical protein